MSARETASGQPLPMVVLIPTHGRPTLLERTVDSVLACAPPADRTVRLIVVENGGRLGAEALLAGKRVPGCGLSTATMSGRTRARHSIRCSASSATA